MLARWHVALVGGIRMVFASIKYREGKPPKEIYIAGTTYVKKKEEDRTWTKEDA